MRLPDLGVTEKRSMGERVLADTMMVRIIWKCHKNRTVVLVYALCVCVCVQ